MTELTSLAQSAKLKETFFVIIEKMSSLKWTAALLVAFMLLTFWGVLAQANAESLGVPATYAVDRFFDSYFIWVLGVVPLPAFKTVALLACVNIVASMAFRMPRGWKNAGLWLMHVALLVLLVGGIAGSAVKREYNGFAVVHSESAEGVKFFDAKDSLGTTPVDIVDAWPYYVQYRGDIPMPDGKQVAMYKAFYDPFHVVPYAFMVLFLLGAAFHYAVKVRASRKGGQQKPGMENHPGRVAKIVPLLVMLAALFPAHTQASARPTTIWEGLHADSPVLVDSAVRPFDSFARGMLDDLSGRVSYKCRGDDGCDGKLAARDVVRLILLAPEKASRLLLFKVLREDVSEALHLPLRERYVSYAELAPSRDLLELYASREDKHPATAEMRRLYGNVRLYESVVSRTAFSVVGNGADAPTVDSGRISAEVTCHWMNLALWAFVMAFAACLLSSLNLVFKSRKIDVVANVAGVAAAGILALLFALRTYIAARVPLSSLYEIVLLVAMLLVAFEAGAFWFCKRRTYSLMVPVTFMAALLLFFAKFVLEPGDTFRPIPAVLNSSVFLTLHVFTIALGFAGMILSGVVSHLVLFRGPVALPSAEVPKGSPLYSLMYGTLVFGAVFTIVGTLLGGVWADYAWGRFWGFDPKECGALFVILWAMFLLHLRVGRLVDGRTFAMLNCFNVIVTFICWFGVNLLGVGLHSYGFQGGTAAWLGAFIIVDVLLILLIRRFVVGHTK